jgi:hypothetical protein
LKTEKAILDHDLWLKALKTLAPASCRQPKNRNRRRKNVSGWRHWIKYDAFGIDARNPDPGRVTVRRLNRVEYRNTIRTSWD